VWGGGCVCVCVGERRVCGGVWACVCFCGCECVSARARVCVCSFVMCGCFGNMYTVP